MKDAFKIITQKCLTSDSEEKLWNYYEPMLKLMLESMTKWAPDKELKFHQSLHPMYPQELEMFIYGRGPQGIDILIGRVTLKFRPLSIAFWAHTNVSVGDLIMSWYLSDEENITQEIYDLLNGSYFKTDILKLQSRYTT